MPMKNILIFLVFILSYPCYSQQSSTGPNKLYPILFNYARDLYPDYGKIPFERKAVLEEIANYLIGAQQLDNTGKIIFIETDHLARSVMVQAWAMAASYYYGIENVKIYSGGINASKISKNAIIALEKAGFIIYKIQEGSNPEYEIKYSYNIEPLILRSIKYNDKSNPNVNFGSIIICSNADINLPVVKGNNFRTSLHYFDPSAYDGTSDAPELYLEKSKEIATEMFYLFYVLKNSK
jgi:arsenate reductase